MQNNMTPIQQDNNSVIKACNDINYAISSSSDNLLSFYKATTRGGILRALEKELQRMYESSNSKAKKSVFSVELTASLACTKIKLILVEDTLKN